jgi:hypothetical protein
VRICTEAAGRRARDREKGAVMQRWVAALRSAHASFVALHTVTSSPQILLRSSGDGEGGLHLLCRSPPTLSLARFGHDGTLGLFLPRSPPRPLPIRLCKGALWSAAGPAKATACFSSFNEIYWRFMSCNHLINK